jgi:hypothetical protein
MRLMMLTASDPMRLEPCLERGLSDSAYQLRPVVIDTPPITLRERALRLLAPAHGFPEYNSILLAEASAQQPNVVWIFKGMEVYPNTLRTLRRQGAMLVNYNPDHPFRFFSRGSGNANVIRGIAEYDLHLSYSRRIARELVEYRPGTHVAVVPFGHDVSDAQFEQIDSEDEIVKVCFLGNPDSHRARSITQLAQSGIPIDVYGERWDRYLKPTPLVRINGAVRGEDMLRTLRRYRVQLNFFRPHNVDSHNMRSFEVPACGGIMLAEDSTEHREFFESGSEAFFFRSIEEMVGLARHLLMLAEADAQVIRRAARRRSVHSGYFYSDRARAAFQAIREVHERRCASLRTKLSL